MPTSFDGLSLPGPRPWIMAHRGASDHAPENSLAAFRLALEHGADLIETDLWLTADEAIVCHHDATLQRMTGDPRRVDQTSWSDIRSLRLRPKGGYGDQHVPRLSELLEVLPPDIAVILELKDPTFARPERGRLLLRLLEERIARRRAGVISTDRRLLATLKEQAPELVTGHIAMFDPLGDRRADLLGPFWPILRCNPWYVSAAHRRGQRVCPLDPDLHRRLERYLELDVDAVLTNDPRETRLLIERLRDARS